LSASNTARRMPLFFIVFMQSVNQWMYTVSPQQEERITRNIDMFMITNSTWHNVSFFYY